MRLVEESIQYAKDRIFANSTPEPMSGCWLWLGPLAGNGYARFRLNGKNQMAHRVSYELFKSEIPTDLCIDHLCRVRCCVNPDHLEAVTIRENIMRGIGLTAQNAKKTCCSNSHPYTDENTHWDAKGKRSCEICRRTARCKYREKRKTGKP